MSHVLYLVISFFSSHSLINTHLYPTSLTTLGIWTIGPNTSHFSNEYNFVEIYSFHFLPVFSILTFIRSFYFEILIISYDVNSHLERKYIVNDKSTSTPFFSIYELIIEISSLLETYTFSGANYKTYASHRATCLNYASLGVS